MKKKPFIGRDRFQPKNRNRKYIKNYDADAIECSIKEQKAILKKILNVEEKDYTSIKIFKEKFDFGNEERMAVELSFIVSDEYVAKYRELAGEDVNQ